MKKRVIKVANQAMKVLTSPHVVLAFNIAGAALQLLHQVQAFRRGERKIGFRTEKEE